MFPCFLCVCFLPCIDACIFYGAVTSSRLHRLVSEGKDLHPQEGVSTSVEQGVVVVAPGMVLQDRLLSALSAELSTAEDCKSPLQPSL